jgi:hypothetical protein
MEVVMKKCVPLTVLMLIVLLTGTAQAQNPYLTWAGPDSGPQNSVWDFTSTNWYDGVNHGQVFTNGAHVLFTNYSAGDTITIDPGVQPGNVRVHNNDGNTWTFDGANGWGGTGTLIKAGTRASTLTIRTTNSFTGPVELWGGHIYASYLADAGEPSAIGAYATPGASGMIMSRAVNGEYAIFHYTGGGTNVDRGFTHTRWTTQIYVPAGVKLGLGDCQWDYQGSIGFYSGAGSVLSLGTCKANDTANSVNFDCHTANSTLIVASVTGKIGSSGTGTLQFQPVASGCHVIVPGTISATNGQIWSLNQGSFPNKGKITFHGTNTYESTTKIGSQQGRPTMFSVSFLADAGVPCNLGAYPSAGAQGLWFNDENSRLEYTGTNATTDRGFRTHDGNDTAFFTLTRPNTTLTMGDCTVVGPRLYVNGTNNGNSRLVLGNVAVENNNFRFYTGHNTTWDLSAFQAGNLSITSITGANRNVWFIPRTNTEIYVSSDIDLGIGYIEIVDDGGTDGTVIFGGSNTYSGGTDVEDDMKFRVINVGGSATGSGDVDLYDRSSIGGTGAISGSLTVRANCSIDLRGYDIGAFNLQGFTMADGSTPSKLFLDYDGNRFDCAAGGGSLTLNAGGLRVDLNEVSPARDGVYDAMTWSLTGSSIGGSMVFTNGTTNLTRDTASFQLHLDEPNGLLQIIVTDGLASIENDAASNVTATTAFMNGELTSTGGQLTSVWLFWGSTDEGTNKTWEHTNVFGVQGTGILTTNITGLSASTQRRAGRSLGDTDDNVHDAGTGTGTDEQRSHRHLVGLGNDERQPAQYRSGGNRSMAVLGYE